MDHLHVKAVVVDVTENDELETQVVELEQRFRRVWEGRPGADRRAKGLGVGYTFSPIPQNHSPSLASTPSSLAVARYEVLRLPVSSAPVAQLTLPGRAW